jgi:hypothetical protein
MTTPISLGKILGYAGLAVLGALVALAGALVEDGWFPGGLLLALAGCAALFYGGYLATGSRVGVAVPAAFWLVCVVLLSSTRSEGDFLLAAGAGSYLYLLGGALLAVFCATVPHLTSSGRKSA